MVAKVSPNSDNSTDSKSVQKDIQDTKRVTSKSKSDKKSRVPQSDVPYYSLDQALRIPRAIGDNYAFHPTQPLDVAAALEMQPSTSSFRMLAGSAVAYGLTEGGYGVPLISVKPLARRILKPQEEGDDILARREAFLLPRVPREFLNKYDGNKFPRDEIAKNVLQSMGVPTDALDRTLKLIIEGARSVGFLRDIKGITYVKLQNITPVHINQSSIAEVEASDLDSYEAPFEEPDTLPDRNNIDRTTSQIQRVDNRRVFITHGKNKSFVEPLKELLAFGELEPIVSVERESVSQPVPDKVMNDMRNCSAAIIHIEDERKLIDTDGNQQIILNSNVLIEIGAAMALYGRRFILLVKSGIELPSNLQGLYQVRYEGDKLDGEATIRLLKAIREMKNQTTPTTTM